MEHARRAVYRVAQEARYAVARHAAHSTRCGSEHPETARRRSYAYSRRRVAFDAAQPVAGRGASAWGCLGMRERLEMVGGQLAVELHWQRHDGHCADSARQRQEGTRLTMKSEKPITVLLADDHMIVREGLKKLLESESDIEVVGEAATGRARLELSQEGAPT